MKKISTLVAAVCLILWIPVYAFGAINHSGVPYGRTDTWFTITPSQPYIELSCRDYYGHNAIFEVDYYQNHQTFINFSYSPYFNIYTERTEPSGHFVASYLTNSGFFTGLYLFFDNRPPDYSYRKIRISPGYLFDLDEFSYIAVSFDYVSNHTISDVKILEVNARYYTDNMRVVGTLLAHTKSEYGTDYLDLGINYKMNDSIVIGGSLYFSETSLELYAGGTYKSDFVIVDGCLLNYNSTSGERLNDIGISGMFFWEGKFRVGAEYYKTISEKNGSLYIKANAEGENSSFVVKFRLNNDTYNSMFSLAYIQKL